MAWDVLSGREKQSERSRMHRGISWRNGQAATARGMSGIVARHQSIHGALANLNACIWITDKRVARDNESLDFVSRNVGSDKAIGKTRDLASVPGTSLQSGRQSLSEGGRSQSIRVTVTAGIDVRTHGGDTTYGIRPRP